MKFAIHTFAALSIVCALPTALGAKGSTSRIVIAGANLASPIEWTDAAVVSTFQIWAGPGTRTCIGDRNNCVDGTDGFIVDWSSGPVAQRPDGLPRYEVSFYVTDNRFPERPRPPESLAYVVSDQYDAQTSEGYVYLPGLGDDRFRLNVRSILRGVEGHWFRATPAWQRAVVPLLSQR